AGFARQTVELSFEVGDLAGETVLPFEQALRPILRRTAELLPPRHRALGLGGHLLLGPRHPFGPAQGVLHAALHASRPVALEPASCIARPRERRLALGGAGLPALAALARPLHGIGSLLQAARGLLHRGRRALAREPLQLPRQLLGVPRQVAGGAV